MCAEIAPQAFDGASLPIPCGLLGFLAVRVAKLDVSLLQQLIVTKLCPSQKEQEAILYTKDGHEALQWVAQGTGTGALLLNATKVSEVQAVATAGERMPHKSTYFFPKPLTGLVINVMENR